MKNKNNLLIISDSKMQKIGSDYFAFNSVVLELGVFKFLFEKIFWIGFNYSDNLHDSSLMLVEKSDAQLIFLPRSGGSGVIKKSRTVLLMPLYIFELLRNIYKNKFIHVRGPSIPMFLSLLISFFFRKKTWIFKYANNWNDKHPPLFWGIQKSLMIQFHWTYGTVNGKWPDMPKHLFAFENPCINDQVGNADLLCKFFTNKKKLLFVGRIENEKGIKSLLESIRNWDCSLVEKLTLVGTGRDLQILLDFLKIYNGEIEIEYLGIQEKSRVMELMRENHFLILPTTASEGFPKVIAESWAEACIPISTDVSCITQYLENSKNGFIWDFLSNQDLSVTLNEALSVSNNELIDIARNGQQMSQLFSYSNYKQRLMTLLNNRI